MIPSVSTIASKVKEVRDAPSKTELNLVNKPSKKPSNKPGINLVSNLVINLVKPGLKPGNKPGMLFLTNKPSNVASLGGGFCSLCRSSELR